MGVLETRVELVGATLLTTELRLRVRDFDLCCPFRPATSTYFYSLDEEIGRCTISNVLIMLSLSRRAVKPVLKAGTGGNRWLSTTAVDHGKEGRSNIRSRRGKKVSKNAALMDELVVAAQNVYNIEPPFTPTSPLTRTPHPVNPHQAAEEDPYEREPVMCILCPRRYAVPIVPDYKNPKLLAQFVSPHTGFTYQKHITGLCEHMQKKVEAEVIKSQRSGFMAYKIKEAIYLKDH